MTRFEFRLARLARVRAVEETLARERFQSAELAARETEALAGTHRESVARAEDDLRAQQCAGKLAPRGVLSSLGVIDGLRAGWRAAVERARSQRFQAEEMRRAWGARVREKKSLTRLEGRDRAAWRMQESRVDARTIDEIASIRAARLGRPSRENFYVPMGE